ncbi:Hsp33 family molecular chaperone HslO [Ketogulonicigenium vulgare]|uniref:Chaperonin HslO n=1 Tax=Ketogulonicigenium vulgare (strain WSH-001) TaxID=759362 RepID=F9Y674_KETVW|nr:Hsp33 family molecular chaperone HslO [Ketogulonicigenium vulgare]ADO43808.1 chaperonin HslO [Ketogulonicigenium vulgare Y25]AEM42071.1 Chaperonin HslO [Ketogulonicigenium vulgare WSH-001]ALJ82164.1 molecular chaperone Hsp33 [Ketogulonicigenium vulgare]ANW34785.1 molecular chaperone Hsp33 [Ketogulonicigenium vulgare]AOZ55842.1 chaperonin HslO [Ketogulonicigenium vulgare]
MTQGTQLAWDDTVLPFQLDLADVRGRVARLDGVLQDVLRQHNYPAAIEGLVAEAVLLTALIGQTIDLRWKLSIQVRGDGPARIIATDYYGPSEDGQPARIRGYASFDPDRLDPDAEPFSLIGEKGYFAILIDQGEGTEPYSGITSLEGGSLAACAEAYFRQSEQIPTRFALSYGRSHEPGRGERWRAGGVMLQHMPKASSLLKVGEGQVAPVALPETDDGENWNRANVLLDTVEELELIGPNVTSTSLLTRLFHEEQPRVFETQAVQFGCSCSEDKVRQSLSIYSQKDIAHMVTTEGTVTADCQFCGAHYVLDPKTVGFVGDKPPGF